MYTNLNDFMNMLKTESDSTIKLFSTLTDTAISQQICQDHRTLGRIAWHIITTVPEMMSQTGLEFAEVEVGASVPDTVEEIVDAYKIISNELRVQITSKWTDDDLSVEDNMYGEQWKRGLTLAILLHHEIHHRGQMTVLMRQAGLIVPGIYGPAMEEWEKYGKSAPEI